ncbi:M14 family zinc carboxypeptidase [Flavobacteriaceae bacterium]|nr:M14 family zinc carboxypeptidase [Flavobacteriaceae bacterium]MDB3873977.1 M14 family zinc carboxypeptidase [Flavobacteriaceae bacterium]MDC0879057.1 M14 family zinc carboxypeptidase [Flavobacteriaceae bacterium]
MKRLLFILTPLFCLNAQVQLDYYLNDTANYNPSIPTPESVIGHQVGEFHVSHDKLSHYVQELSKSSKRVKLVERGKTYENRTSWLMIITSESNHSNLEKIREEHIKLSDSKNEDIDVSKMPIVVYQGFSVHGDEPSGSNASLLLMYHLLASDSNETQQLLENTVILLDPSFNPDGLQRFSQWANMNKNQSLNPDPSDREYNQYWPRGRTNHYWFDLNRDMLPNQLPETNAKIETFTNWMPNILTDHHEMGTNSSFFFQPGVPERKNPLISDLNQALTKEIGTYHEDALNKIGSLYYSEESYDDFFFGKASTYPDANGSIGILFEQGSSRGHIQESVNGILTFPFTIRNQLTAAFSTLKAAQNMRVKLLNYMKDFHDKQIDSSSKNESIIFGKQKDRSTVYHLAEVLKSHKIKFNTLSQDAEVNGTKYSKDNSFIVPLNQPKRTLIRAMFDTQTSFNDSLFYDVSAWTFPLAFNVNYDNTNRLNKPGKLGIKSKEVENLKRVNGSVDDKSDYAYIFEPHEYYAQAAVYQLIKSGLRVKTATRTFSINGEKFDFGTYMIPVQNQSLNSDEIYNLLVEISSETGINVKSQSTGITDGIDLGSNNFEIVKEPKIGLIVGEGVRSYDAGEIWHLLDTRFNIPITKLDVGDLGYIDLSRYTHIILPDYSEGSQYQSTGGNINKNQINDYIKDGGNLIAYRNSVKWVSSNLSEIDFHTNEINADDVTFSERQSFFGAQQTGGAIFNSIIDKSHPVNYGIESNSLPLFRNSNVYMTKSEQSFNNPIVYSPNPLMSGYISEENLSLLKKAVPFKVIRSGKGKILLMTDNTNFRAFWFGTNRILLNMLFHSNIM